MSNLIEILADPLLSNSGLGQDPPNPLLLLVTILPLLFHPHHHSLLLAVHPTKPLLELKQLRTRSMLSLLCPRPDYPVVPLP